jgi:hypothetical protein
MRPGSKSLPGTLREATSMQTNRRELLALLASGAVYLGGFPATASAQQLRRVRVGKAIISSFPFAGLELGATAGIWKSAGLAVEISPSAADGQLQQALTSGSVDFGLRLGPGMGYAAKGCLPTRWPSSRNRPRTWSRRRKEQPHCEAFRSQGQAHRRLDRRSR